jgi:hypothetical protein
VSFEGSEDTALAHNTLVQVGLLAQLSHPSG